MTKTILPRLGVSQWSSDSDTWPGRVGTNADLATINANAAVWLQDLMANRPSPAYKGRYFWATDTRRMWYDNGTSWDEVSPIGGGGVPSSLAIGAGGSEGTSRIGARADHTHPFPAPSVTPGALAYASTGAIGSANTPARADHTHTLPQLPFATSPPGINVYGDASAAGSSLAVARGDHTHALDLSDYHSWKTYTPVWKSVNPNDVQPSGGTIVARYIKLGQWCWVEMHILFESNVQGGRDNLYVSLPFTPVAGIPEQSINCKLWSPNTGTWTGNVVMNPGSLAAYPLFPYNAQDCRLITWRQNAPGVTDPAQGIPKPSTGASVIESGGRFYMWGAYQTVP